MTKKQKFVPLALPDSRIRAFVIKPETVKEFFGKKPNRAIIRQNHEKAEEFMSNNLGESGPKLVKK